jgi:hypothetical protein
VWQSNCLAIQSDTRWRAGPERWTYIKYFKWVPYYCRNGKFFIITKYSVVSRSLQFIRPGTIVILINSILIPLFSFLHCPLCEVQTRNLGPPPWFVWECWYAKALTSPLLATLIRSFLIHVTCPLSFFSIVFLFWKHKRRRMRSPCCLCVCVYPLPYAWKPEYWKEKRRPLLGSVNTFPP